jgi:hypothetical protein
MAMARLPNIFVGRAYVGALGDRKRSPQRQVYRKRFAYSAGWAIGGGVDAPWSAASEGRRAPVNRRTTM